MDDSEIKRNFGARIRSIRQSQQISQELLAGHCGLDRSYIGGVERGQRNVSLINIYRIASALNIQVTELFDYE